MRVLTVRQPWAWAIVHGGKDVENRVRNVAGSYRGPIAIHVGLQYDTAWSSPAMYEAMKESGAHTRRGEYPWHENHGAIIGVVDLVDAHHHGIRVQSHPGGPFEEAPCSPWALPDNWHLQLANPRQLDHPVLFRGALGLRTLDQATADQILKGSA